MLIGGDDISNDVITLYTWFSMFVYIRARFHFALIGGNLTALSTGSHRGLEFKFQRRSCDSLCGSNLVPRVLSYPPYGAREGRREPWERGWHGRRLKEKGKLPWELARRLNLVTLVQHKSDENHCCITPLGEMTNQLHFTRPKCRWDTLNKTWWKG